MIKIIEKLLLVALFSIVSASYAENPEVTPTVHADKTQVSAVPKSSIIAVKYVRNISNPNGFGESYIINGQAFYEKSGDVKAESGDKLEYAIVITASNANNKGRDLEGVAIKDAIPAYTEYLPDSTMINSVKIDDIEGKCPLLETLMVNDASSPLLSGIIKAETSAVVMFRVRVNLMLDLPEIQ